MFGIFADKKLQWPYHGFSCLLSVAHCIAYLKRIQAMTKETKLEGKALIKCGHKIINIILCPWKLWVQVNIYSRLIDVLCQMFGRLLPLTFDNTNVRQFLGSESDTNKRMDRQTDSHFTSRWSAGFAAVKDIPRWAKIVYLDVNRELLDRKNMRQAGNSIFHKM